MAASITISTPASNSSVSLAFTATGTYVCDTTPTIDLVLYDSSGNPVAIGGPVVAMGGNWAGPITATTSYTGATVTASIEGTIAAASATNITVQ